MSPQTEKDLILQLQWGLHSMDSWKKKLLCSFLWVGLSACNPTAQTSIGPNFYPGVEISYANSVVTTQSPSVLSGSSEIITLSLEDTNFNPFLTTLDSISFQISGGTSTGTFSAVTNNGDGTYSASFSGIAAGTATTIHAFVNGNEIQSAAPTVTVLSGNYSLANSVVSVSDNSVASGSSITATLTVKDASGNQNGSGGLTVLFSNFGGTSTGTFSATTDHHNGTYSATFTGEVGGTATTIGATIQGNAITSALPSVTVTGGTAASITAMAGTPQSVTAGSAVSSNLVAVVKDSNLNVLSGVTVTWAISSGGGTLNACTMTTDNSGLVHCGFTTSTIAEVSTITASVSGVSTPATFTVTGTASSTIASIVWGTAPSLSYSASNSTPMTTFTAVLKDSNGNTITSNHSTTVTASITSGPGALTGSTTVTAIDGIASFSAVTDTSAGTITIEAQENTSNHFVSQANILVQPGAATSIAISSGNPQSGLVNQVLTNPFQVIVKDANGNIVPGTTVNWAIAAGSGSLSSTANATNSSGISGSTFTLGNSAGNESVTATLNGTSTHVTFTASARGFSNVRPITINSNQVGGADETNFPMLFTGTYPDLATVANGGLVTNANGYDIIFATDSLCTAPVPGWEIQSYSPNTGAMVFWIDVPSLSSTSDTVIYLCYGNASITTPQSTAANTWDSHFTGVWHMNDDAANTTVTDSTGTNNGVNAANTADRSVAGKFGNAISYNGFSDGTDLGSILSYISAGTPFTVEIWAYINSVNGWPVLVELDDSGGSNWEFFASNMGGYTGLDIGSSSGWARGYNGATAPTGAWHSWAVTYDGESQSSLSDYTMYEDAVVQSLGNPNGFGGHNNHTYFGRDEGNFFDGAFEEIKFSNIARSSNWITAEFNNQNSPSTFYTVGSTLY